MPIARARVDLHLIPEAPGLWDRGVAAGWWTADGSPGPAATALVAGGFARARWTETERPRLIANGLGGFQVRCPACGRPAVVGLARAMARLRDAGVVEDVPCGCGAVTPIGALAFRPPAAFTRADVALLDAGDGALTPDGQAAVGPGRVVARRP